MNIFLMGSISWMLLSIESRFTWEGSHKNQPNVYPHAPNVLDCLPAWNVNNGHMNKGKWRLVNIPIPWNIWVCMGASQNQNTRNLWFQSYCKWPRKCTGTKLCPLVVRIFLDHLEDHCLFGRLDDGMLQVLSQRILVWNSYIIYIDFYHQC